MCSSSFNSCSHTGGTLGRWCLVTHSQVTVSSSSAQSPLGPPIYSKTCLLPVLHSCLWIRAGSPIPPSPSNALSTSKPSASFSLSEGTTAPPWFIDAFYACLGRPQTGTHPAAAVQGDRQPSTSWVWSNGWTFEREGKNWSLEFSYNLISLNTQLDIT